MRGARNKAGTPHPTSGERTGVDGERSEALIPKGVGGVALPLTGSGSPDEVFLKETRSRYGCVAS